MNAHAMAVSAIFSFVLAQASFADGTRSFPHIDLEMSSRQLEKLYSADKQTPLIAPLKTPHQQLTPASHRDIIDMGRINLRWLNLINEHREIPIQLNKPGELRGIPIEEPMSYGPSTIETSYNSLMAELPEVMKFVLLGDTEMTKEVPFEDEEVYRQWAKRVDRLYQTTLRWEMMRRWLGHLEQRLREDIRGYHFLSKIENLEQYLGNHKSLPIEEQERVKLLLQTLCYNSNRSSRGFRACRQEAKDALDNGSAYTYSQRYWERAQQTYEGFFKIPRGAKNRSTRFVNGVLQSRFRQTTDTYREFLKSNIEDELNFKEFRFEAKFTNSNSSGVFVQWVPEATPHVKGLGSDHIVMDANSSLDDWDTQWTIRHEFGHVIGLPDCYVEFYERDKNLITNYQIDVDDLMCSRKGVMNDRIVEELEGFYGK